MVRKGRPPKSGEGLQSLTTTSEYLSFYRAIAPREKLDPEDIHEMRRRFNNYIDMCIQYNVDIGNLAAYHAIGISKEVADIWKARDRSVNTERAEFLDEVDSLCAAFRESQMQTGKLFPATGIWWQKNYDGLKDVHESRIVEELHAPADLKSIQERYGEVIDVDFKRSEKPKLTVKTREMKKDSEQEEIPLETAETASEEEIKKDPPEE